MLAGFHDCGFKFPQRPVLRLHDQIVALLVRVVTDVCDDNMERLTPRRVVMDAKFQFHTANLHINLKIQHPKRIK